MAQSVVDSSTFIGNVKLKIKRNSSKCKYEELIVTDVARIIEEQEIQTNFRWGTVHSVKGESCDAVMLVLKSKVANNKKYITMLDDNLIQNEELRIIYVALSRAKKAVCLAVPIEDKEKWEAKLTADKRNGPLSHY